MRVAVRSEVIRNNLELLKDLIGRAGKHIAASELSDFDAFVEISTGSLILPKKIAFTDHRLRAIRIRWVADSAQAGGFFEIYDQSKEGKVVFHSGDLSGEAQKVLGDTIHTINHIFTKEIRENGLENAITFLEQMQITSPDSELFKGSFHPDIDRKIAEKMLNHFPCGTYLFRKDSFATILEEELSIRFAEPIRCFTLTAVVDGGKVIDSTVVERLGRFQIYNDDPLLEKPSFSSLQNLLQSLFEVCKIPLPNHKPHR